MRNFVDSLGYVVANYRDDVEVPLGSHPGCVEVWLPDDVLLDVEYEPGPDVVGEGGEIIPGEPVVAGYKIPDLDASTARRVAEQTIRIMYAWALDQIAGHATPIEMATWTPKRQLVEDLNSGDADKANAARAALAAMVPDNEAEANGLASEADRALYMAAKIAPKAQAYSAAMTAAEKARREAWASLAALPDDADALMGFASAVRAAASARLQEFMEALGNG